MEEKETSPEQTTVKETPPEQTTGDETTSPEQTTVNETPPVERSIEMPPEQTTILLGVSQSTKGYPHPSQSSLHALEWVLQKLIHKSSKSEFKLLIVHVKVPDEDGIDEIDSIYASSADIRTAQRKSLKQALELLEVFLNKCHEAEVPVEGWVKLGDPKDVICTEVLRVKPDMLILGSRGLGPLQRIFVGGVSSYCAKKVECPILIIKRKPEDMPEDASED